jgi:hypothetical protein
MASMEADYLIHCICYTLFGKVSHMWLGKLFGRRNRPPEIDPGEEPARFVAPSPRDATGISADFKARLDSSRAPTPASSKPSGFDPYNSGSFKKKDDAWVRVGRR